MRIVITGANGFVGSALVARLLVEPSIGHATISEIVLVDQHFSNVVTDNRLTFVTGDFGEPDLLERVFSEAVDIVFHLASVPGSLAERDPELGYRVNLLGTLALFECIARKSANKSPRIVFASSIAVYGSHLPSVIDLATPTNPAISYGAHKRMAEIMLADLTRRGQVDGLSLRLPGIVARPGISAGFGSAFMSAIMHAVANGSRYTCPVSLEASCWWMSWPCCIDNLIHAAGMNTATLEGERTYPLPVLHTSLRQVVGALERRFGQDRVTRITYEPDESIQRLFGSQPRLYIPEVEAMGFKHDGTEDSLVMRALQ